MPLEQDDLVHRALWWAKRAGYGKVNNLGQVRVDPASRTQIACRWTDKKKDVMRPDGSYVRLDALIAADRALSVGDVVWRGGLADLDANGATGTGTGTGGQLPDSDFMQVVMDNTASDVLGIETRYEYGLVKWGNTLPLL